MKKSLIIFFFFLTCYIPIASATHNRAGEITYQHMGGLTYKVIVTTYTKDSSPADRPDLEIFWGDGTSDTIQRTNGSGDILGNDIKKNEYEGIHTYGGVGEYILSMEDPNRNSDIINIPGSVNISFYIKALLIISPWGVGNYNNSPLLLNPPIDDACVSKKFIHNPGAYDPDGDSLSYALDTCKGAGGTNITGYFIPNNVSINPLTGDLIWNTPTTIGEYNFVIIIKEWRRGPNGPVLIGYIWRDMQVTVGVCENSPPVITVTQDTCVIAGTTLNINVIATDQDSNNTVTLSATGGPLQLTNSPAQFPQPVSGLQNVSSVFSWETICAHVRQQPYSVLFKALDDDSPINLSDYKTLNIKVVGPPPQNPTATPEGNSIILNWDQSICSEVIKYKIYRKNGLYGFNPTHCELGVPAYTGYSLIATVNGVGNTTHIDNNNGSGLIHGVQYCYMVVAIFPDNAESIASEEFCAELKKDVPIITNVSVTKTNVIGLNYVAWSKPTELDTVQNPGPYKYLIYRSPDINGSNFTLIDSTEFNITLNDTIYYDSTANTLINPNSYRIDLYQVAPGNRYLIGSTHNASSVFLDIAPSDNALTLSWQFNVPWTNTEYVIYRFNDLTSTFDSVTTTISTTYIDAGLINNQSYCYYIKSIGAYSITGIINPIINLSQEQCGVPVDLEAPCPPDLTVIPDCDLIQNTLSWNNPNNSCADDVVQYHVYYTPVLNGTFEKVKTVYGNSDTTLIHNNNNISIAGCYYVTAVDSFNNESSFKDSICVDNCPTYVLPNVFSPDGDGVNDYFKPFPYKYVESVDIKILNRWGQQMFETTDPDIFWNGVNKATDKPCSEGVYYYTCTVNEIRLSGIETRVLKGFFHLFRNSDIIPKSKEE